LQCTRYSECFTIVSICFIYSIVQDADTSLNYGHLEFRSELKSLSRVQRNYMNLLEQLFNVEEPIHILSELVRPDDFQVLDMINNENSLLVAVVEQLKQNNIVTDPQQLGSEAVNYLRKYPNFDDGSRLLDIEDYEKWDEYLTKMVTDHLCDHLLIVVLAEILQTVILIHSAADKMGWPLIIFPNNLSQSPPIHVGHVSRLNFVALRKHVKKKPVEATNDAYNRKKVPEVSDCLFLIDKSVCTVLGERLTVVNSIVCVIELHAGHDLV